MTGSCLIYLAHIIYKSKYIDPKDLGVIEVLNKKLETAQQYDKKDENESDESD